jgi:hypothetical protein
MLELLEKEAIRDIRTKWDEALDSKNWVQFVSLLTDEIDTDFSDWGMEPQIVTKSILVQCFLSKVLEEQN